jgi:CRP-like cAMP-binding protein
MTENEILIAARLFQSANPDVARKLSAVRARVRAFTAGQTIFEAGEAADGVFVLSAARDAGAGGAEPLVQVRLVQDGAARALRLARIVKGDVFGETELLAAGLDPKAGKRTTNARALTAGRAIGLSYADLAELLEIDPAIRTRLLKLGSRRLLDAVWAQHSIGNEDPDIVLADWLVEYAADLGVSASNRVSFPRKLSQSEIADELGVSRETVSRRLKEWERSGLVISSAAGLELVDYSRLVRIAGLISGRDRGALARAVADVAAEVDAGDLIDARNIGADMLRYFPSSPELLHLAALASARSGDGEEAVAILKGARLTAEGDLDALRERVARALENPFASMERIATSDFIDEGFDDDEEVAAPDSTAVERLVADLAALEARLLKDHAFAAGDGAESALAAESHRAYAAIWRRVGNWYAGVNAAAMALASGDTGEAKALAGEILKRLPKEPKDYWAAATRAEALFLSGDNDAGMAALRHAGETQDATESSRASTSLQLRRLAPRLGLEMNQVSAALGIRSVLLVTGHLFRGVEMSAEVQAEAAERIRAQTEAILKDRNAGNVFGALASGTDIVVAETALDLGIPFHAVLPFPVARYAELSVAIGDPPDASGHWRKRFDDVLARAASLTLTDDELPLDRDLDGHFYYSFRFMAGMALMRAELLEAECRLLAVTDGASAKNIAGSSRAVADWLEAGRAVDHIAFPYKRSAPAGRARGGSSFRPCVLLWDATDARADLDSVKKSGLAKKKEFLVVPRTSRAGGEGTCVVAPDLVSAMQLAEACAKKSETLRVICDFGPVLGGEMEPDPKMIARLKSGSDMPGFPTGRAIATLTFATQAVVEFGARLDVKAVGRAEEGKADGEARGRRKSGLPVYRLALRG